MSTFLSDLKEWEKSYTRITDEENFQEDVYLDYSVFMNGEEEMGQNIYVDHEMSSEPSGDISSNTENVPEENPDDYCTNMSYNRETLLEENHISDYCIILSNDDDENVDNDGNLSSKAFQETLYNGDHYNEITFRDEVTPKSNENCDDTDSNESQQYTGNDFEKQESDRQKHACLYCGEFYRRISTHYLRCHSGRPEVFQILKFPSGSKSRKLRFDTLKDKGDSKHAETSRSKSGVKIWKKRNNNSKTHTGKLKYHTASGNDEDKGADEDKQHQSKYKISCDSNVKGRRKTERHLAKGRRTPWSKKEERIVMRHLGHCVKFGRTPCKQECEAVKKSAPKILRDRTWVMIKLFIRNRILREMKGIV